MTGLDELTDEQLIAAFTGGESAAFEELIRRHEQKIFGLCLRIMGDRSDAFDAAQEAFITAFRHLDSFRGDAAFGTWLYRVGINSCKDLLRKRSRIPLGSSETEVQAPDDPAAQVSMRVDIARALQELPEEYREAVVMHDLGGIPYEEIARLTNTRIGTVKSRISRGRRRLAELMELPATRATSKEGVRGNQ